MRYFFSLVHTRIEFFFSITAILGATFKIESELLKFLVICFRCFLFIFQKIDT